ncbi:MAG: FkbM family methyltransferase [Bacteroidota bacterium]
MLAKGKPYRKFIILSSPRSGTHMLRTALRNHVDIVAGSELFNPDFIRDRPFGPETPAKEILDQYIFRDYPPNIKMVGFIIHRSGTPFGNWPNLWPMLAADKSIHVISLRRRNLLRRYLSYQVMRTFRGSIPNPLHFDPERLEKDFVDQEKEIEDFDRRFAGHPLMQIYYEDLCADYPSVVEQVQQFLNVKPQRLWPDIEGKPQRKLSEAIVNFTALKTHFAPTKWASFFNDEEEVMHISKPSKKANGPNQPNPLLERLADWPSIRPLIYIRNRYRESWSGMVRMLAKKFIVQAFQKTVKGKEKYFSNLATTEWALYSERVEELLIRSFFQDQKHGIFVDIGCAWPITHSNTFYLERHLGWSGLAVDANPVRLKVWKKHRPKSRLLTYIISDQSSPNTSFYKAGPLGSIQKERSFGKKIVRGKEIALPAITLNQLLEKHAIESIDFLSIDVEQSELKALRGFDLQRFQPSLVCIEVDRETKDQILTYFEQHQYKWIKEYVHWDQVNWYFTPKK